MWIRIDHRPLLAAMLLFASFSFLKAQTVIVTTTLKPGTMIKTRLESDLSSSSASKDDLLKLRILFATEEGKRVPLPRESKLIAKVVSVKTALRERPGSLTLVLDHLELPDGKTETLRGEIQFMSLKEITAESSNGELTLRGRIEEADKMTIQSSTPALPPAHVNDVAHGEDKSPDKRRHDSSGAIEISKKKGHEVEIAVGTIANVRIVETPAPAPALKTSPDTHK